MEKCNRTRAIKWFYWRNKKLIEKGFQIIIVANQYVIADGIISINYYYSFTGKLLTILQNNGINVLNIYYYPHNDLDRCCYKKPKPGMIEKALKEYDIDMQSSIYCGDSQADYLLAKHFGLTFYGINYSGKENDVRKCNSLLDVCKYIG